MSDEWNFYRITKGWEFISTPLQFAPKNHVMLEQYTRRYEAGELPLDMEYCHYIWMFKNSMDIKRIENKVQP